MTEQNFLTDEQWKEYIEEAKELSGEENWPFWERFYAQVSSYVIEELEEAMRPQEDN